MISHDCQLGNHVIISPGAFLAGDSSIGECTYVGMCAAVREKISIGANTIIGMNSTVLKDIPDNVVALGTPAKVIKTNDNKKVFK